MNNKRPCLLLAAVFVLGTICGADTSLFPAHADYIRSISALGILLLFFYYKKTGLLHTGGMLLLSLAALTAFLNMQRVFRAITLQEDRISAFSDYHVRLDGTVRSFTATDTRIRCVLTDSLLSSAYGNAGMLPEDASPALRARYSQPVGTVILYLDPAEQTALQNICPGQRVCGIGRMVPRSSPANEGQFDFTLYDRSVGVSGSMFCERLYCTGGDILPYRKLLQDIRTYTAGVLSAVCTADDSGIYQAILLGDKGNMNEDLQKLYQESGIAHILAVSGLHLSIIGTGFYLLLARIGLPHGLSGILGAGVILLYGILTGSSGSAMRAVFMLLLKFLSVPAGKSYDMLSSLAVACILLLLTEPFLLFSFGFQLSFLAVLSLGIADELPRMPSLPASALLSSVCLQLITLPVLLYHSFQFPLYGMLLNLIVLPLMSCVMYTGLLAVLLFPLSETLSRISVGGGHTVLSLYTFLCSAVSSWPSALLLPGRPPLIRIFLYYALLFLLFLLTRSLMQRSKAGTLPPQLLKKKRLALPGSLLVLFLAVFLLLPPSRKGLEITALDVGQGDSFIIRKDGLVISIDGGSSSDRKIGRNVIEPYLKSQGIGSIDAAFVSHCDADHMSGILYLLTETDTIRIRSLYLSAPAEGDPRYDGLRDAAILRGTEIRYIRTGDTLRFHDLSLRCLYPSGAGALEDPNRHSSALLLTDSDFRMLFTGDMDQTCEAEMLSAAESADIDILKAGHHGSSTSTGDALLSSTSPEYALLSYGAGNSYGHPHRETLQKLSDRDIRLLETAVSGEIRILSDGSSYRILYPMQRLPQRLSGRPADGHRD